MEIRNKMLFPAVVTGIYALLVMMGGVVGYMEAQSFASLYMGLSCGFSLSLSCLVMLKGKEYSYTATLLFMCLLALLFGYRFAFTHKFMPAGLMMMASWASALMLSVAKLTR